MTHRPRRVRRFAALLAVLCLLTAPAVLPAAEQTGATPPPAGVYQIDPHHTNLYFKIKHMGISFVYGRFDDMAGSVTLGDKPSFEVTIQAKSIDTNVERRDDDLRSKRFFDVEQYPTLEFKSTRVEVDGDSYKVTGDFTLHGQTHEITIPFTRVGVTEMHGHTRIGFEGQLTIDRTRWGMDTMVGAIGKDVHLMLSFEAQQQ